MHYFLCIAKLAFSHLALQVTLEPANAADDNQLFRFDAEQNI